MAINTEGQLLRKCDFELDLFGQVPISRLELKRKLKSDGDLTVNAAIKEIIAQKLEGTFTFSPKYKRPRRFSTPQEIISPQTLEKYLETCRLKTAYQAYLAKIKCEVKGSVKADRTFELQIDKLRQMEVLKQQAYAVIAQLTRSSITHDKQLAKRKGKQYQPRKRTLVVRHIKLFKRAEIDPSLIPWELATAAAIELGKRFRIYEKPKTPIYECGNLTKLVA